jgi:hypothetical protein
MELELLEPTPPNHPTVESSNGASNSPTSLVEKPVESGPKNGTDENTHPLHEPFVGLEHRDLRRDDFWAEIPGYADVGAGEFHTHTFQVQHSATSVRQLRDTLGNLVEPHSECSCPDHYDAKNDGEII